MPLKVGACVAFVVQPEDRLQLRTRPTIAALLTLLDPSRVEKSIKTNLVEFISSPRISRFFFIHYDKSIVPRFVLGNGWATISVHNPLTVKM